MEIYFSTDIESDGPYPGAYSMLSFGTAAFNPEGNLIGTFEANLETLPGAKQHPDTMRFWSEQPDAWVACRKDCKPPKKVMPAYVKWVEDVIKPYQELYGRKVKPVTVGFPITFDFAFMNYYMGEFAKYNPFSFSALDIKTMAMVVLGKEFRQCTKRNFPKRWFSEKKHTHIGIDDAIEQGEMFFNILKESRELKC